MTNLKDITKNESLSLSEQGLSSAQGKLEKITMAIYLVTDFFPNGEPLKYHLRDKCVSLMSFIMSFNNSQESFTKIYSLSSEINSLLKLSASSKLVSEMNYSILVNEYGKFLKMIKDSEPERNMLSRNFFKAEESISEVTTKDKIYKGQYKGQKDRMSLILEFIKSQKTPSIKDIAAKIKDCSEKTIQRELGVLIDQGLIRRVGERRWSHYEAIQ